VRIIDQGNWWKIDHFFEAVSVVRSDLQQNQKSEGVLNKD
jgi:hypothetical protein